jgi:XRE family aerobic/anaerobic benzoate catabolism transcriptional regulator
MTGDSPDAQYLKLLGQRVRTARAERGLSRKSLAELSDVSERYLAQLETGEGNASSIVLRRVARALGLRVAELLDNDQPEELQLLRRFVDSLPADRVGDAMKHLVERFGGEQAIRHKRIALIGLRGAGKSTLGTALATDLHRAFIELDREIESEAGMELSEVFLLYGHPVYRRLERVSLEKIIRSQRDVVVCVGGGAVAEPQTLQLLKSSCFTVWIKASPVEHMARVLAQGDTRPMRGRHQAMQDLKEILASRESLYAQADRTVDTAGKSVEKSLAILRRACVLQPS